MKKNLFLLFLSYASSMMVFGQHQDLTDAANYKRYAEANASLNPEKQINIVFIGNSITEGWVGSNPQFFTENNFVGRGISGQTSPQLLLRFRQDVLNLKPYAVVINIGTNDIAENTGKYTAKFTLDCIRSMAELAKNNGIKVILSSVLPAGEFGWRKEIQDVPQQIDALNEKIKAYAEENNFPYIDYNSAMRDENGALQKEYGRDTVHPNRNGYQVMEKIAKEVIDKIITF